MNSAAANIHCPSCITTIDSILSGFPVLPDSALSRHSNVRASLEKVVVDSLSLITRSRSNSNSSSSKDDYELGSDANAPSAFTDISVSLISGTVSFTHPIGYPLKGVIAELEDAGFDVLRNDSADRAYHLHPHSSTQSRSTWSRFTDLLGASQKKEQAHKDHCVACQEEEETKKQRRPSKAADKKGKQSDRDEGDSAGNLVRAVFSVNGMTCR